MTVLVSTRRLPGDTLIITAECGTVKAYYIMKSAAESAFWRDTSFGKVKVVKGKDTRRDIEKKVIRFLKEGDRTKVLGEYAHLPLMKRDICWWSAFCGVMFQFNSHMRRMSLLALQMAPPHRKHIAKKISKYVKHDKYCELQSVYREVYAPPPDPSGRVLGDACEALREMSRICRFGSILFHGFSNMNSLHDMLQNLNRPPPFILCIDITRQSGNPDFEPPEYLIVKDKRLRLGGAFIGSLKCQHQIGLSFSGHVITMVDANLATAEVFGMFWVKRKKWWGDIFSPSTTPHRYDCKLLKVGQRTKTQLLYYQTRSKVHH